MRAFYAVKQVKLTGSRLGEALIDTVPMKMNPRPRRLRPWNSPVCTNWMLLGLIASRIDKWYLKDGDIVDCFNVALKKPKAKSQYSQSNYRAVYLYAPAP